MANLVLKGWLKYYYNVPRGSRHLYSQQEAEGGQSGSERLVEILIYNVTHGSSHLYSQQEAEGGQSGSERLVETLI